MVTPEHKENAILQKIRDFADHAHGDQRRKYTPDRYIVHPIRVMELCKPYTTNIAVLASALLHDVLEDTPVTKEEIRVFLQGQLGDRVAVQTLNLVTELTDVYVKSSYPRLNRRQRKAKETERIKKTSAEAQTVKYADILDNCREIVQHDRDFAPVFLRECHDLLKTMDKGNSSLRAAAFKVVEDGRKALATT